MNAYLFPGLELGPLAVKRLVEAVPRERHDERTDPDRFSLRQAVAHLADWEPILLGRMQAALEQDGIEIQGIDEGERAIEMRYDNQDSMEQAELFLAHRRGTVAWLRSLGPDDWRNEIVHAERGRMTIYDQANMLLGHDLYHIEHLAQYLSREERVVSTW